jgi:hypothetical protein
MLSKPSTWFVKPHKSKTINPVPYSYMAEIAVIADVKDHFFADTVCALIKKLKDRKVDPYTVRIYECVSAKENTELPRMYWTKKDGYRDVKTTCRSMCKRYWTPTDGDNLEFCRFRDGARTTLFEV